MMYITYTTYMVLIIGFDVSIYVVSLVDTDNCCDLSFPCRYQCEYGSRKDFANVVLSMMDWLHMRTSWTKKKCVSLIERAIKDLKYPKN